MVGIETSEIVGKVQTEAPNWMERDVGTAEAGFLRIDTSGAECAGYYDCKWCPSGTSEKRVL